MEKRMRRTLATRYGFLPTDKGRLRWQRGLQTERLRACLPGEPPITLNAVRALVEKAGDQDVTADLPCLLRALDHEDQGIVDKALEALYKGHFRGTDTREALPKLIRIIDDPEESHYWAFALLECIARRMDLSYLVKAYSEKISNADDFKQNARYYWILGKLAVNKAGIAPALPMMRDALLNVCRELSQRGDAVWDRSKSEYRGSSDHKLVLEYISYGFHFASYKTDISSYAPDLMTAMEWMRSQDFSNNFLVSCGCNSLFWALGRAAWQGADISPAVPHAIEGLKNKQPRAPISLLEEAAEQGLDVSAAIPDLKRLAENTDKDTASKAKNILERLGVADNPGKAI